MIAHTAPETVPIEAKTSHILPITAYIEAARAHIEDTTANVTAKIVPATTRTEFLRA